MNLGAPVTSAGILPPPDPWRDVPPEQQVVLRNLWHRLQEHPGQRYELRRLRGGELQVAEVVRRQVLGRSADVS